MEYAKRGIANAGLTTGIIGTALGALNGAGGLLGMGGCANNAPINRYEAEMMNELNAKDSEIALLKSEAYTDKKLVEVYTNLDVKVNGVLDKIQAFKDEQYAINMQQAVYNGTNTATIACMQGQVAQLMALTKTIVPIGNVCPQPMPMYNNWVAPVADSTTTG